MKYAAAFKAQGIGDKEKEVESVTIIIETEMPSYGVVKEAVLTFDTDAEILADALCKSLPGGTLDRLTAKLLRRKATALVVPLFK